MTVPKGSFDFQQSLLGLLWDTIFTSYTLALTWNMEKYTVYSYRYGYRLSVEKS